VNNEAQRVSYQHVPRGQTYDNFSEQAVGQDQQEIEMCDVYPVKYYKDEGFIERKIEIDEEDLERIIENISAVTRILTSIRLKL